MIRNIKSSLVAFLLLAASTFNGYSTPVNFELEKEQTVEMFLSDQDVKCLARNIYYESRGEPTEGKIAVGFVTLNRVDHPKFPDSVCDVVHHRTRSASGKNVCQFSWVCNKKTTPREQDPMWRESLTIARKLLLGQYPTMKAKYGHVHYFHNTAVNPGWNLRRVAKVGQHVFYR